jgi:hypothetical protein
MEPAPVLAAVSNHMGEIEDDPRSAAEAAAAEIGVALRLTRRAADVELTMAIDLQRRLPHTWGSSPPERSTCAAPKQSITARRISPTRLPRKSTVSSRSRRPG